MYQVREEGLGGEVLVVLFRQLLWALEHLKANHLETLPLKSRDDLPDKTALHAVRLHLNVKNPSRDN